MMSVVHSLTRRFSSSYALHLRRNKVTNLNPLLNPSPFPLFHVQSSPVLILDSPPNPVPCIATIPAKNLKQIEAIESTETLCQ